jgi:hypothetical protein
MSITIAPSLDVSSVARIRYPVWLKDLYNEAQLECTSLDRCGAFHLVALNKDWDEHPGNMKYYHHYHSWHSTNRHYCTSKAARN